MTQVDQMTAAFEKLLAKRKEGAFYSEGGGNCYLFRDGNYIASFRPKAAVTTEEAEALTHSTAILQNMAKRMVGLLEAAEDHYRKHSDPRNKLHPPSFLVCEAVAFKHDLDRAVEGEKR